MGIERSSQLVEVPLILDKREAIFKTFEHFPIGSWLMSEEGELMIKHEPTAAVHASDGAVISVLPDQFCRVSVTIIVKGNMN